MKNDKWVKRIGQFFTQIDLDKNGYVSRQEYLKIIDNLAKAAPGNSAAIAKLREVALEYTKQLGLKEGVNANKQQFTELAAAFAASELARLKKGKATFFGNFNNALFDVVDKNRDGRLTFEEFKVVATVLKYDESSPKATFDLLDRNKDGTIDRKEFIAAKTRFWAVLDDKDTQGLFGDQFE